MNASLSIIFATASYFFSLPPKLLDAVCYVESKHSVSAYVKHDGNTPSYGICQIKLETARHMGFKGTPEELMKPNRNIYFAAKYLRYQLKKYNNVEQAVMAYNQGYSKTKSPTSYSKKVRNTWKLIKNATKDEKPVFASRMPSSTPYLIKTCEPKFNLFKRKTI